MGDTCCSGHTHTQDNHHTCENTANPILAHATRGNIIESVHRGRYAIVDVAGNVRDEIGDCDALTYPRSSAKIFQALPMILSSAHTQYGLSDEEIAIVCASHRGELEHIRVVESILRKAGLDATDLECGMHPPTHRKSADNLIKMGTSFCAIHNTCSGKHAGMLLYAKKMGWDTKGYIHPDHPVQQSIKKHMADICGYNMENAPMDRDGCSVPTWAIPLKNLAYGFACIADPDETLPPIIAEGIKTLTHAINKHPFMIAGTKQCCTDVMTVLQNKTLVKFGAEAVYLASLPEYGIGIAIKIDDGSIRACNVVLLRILEMVGVLKDADKQKLMHHYQPSITNWNGYNVGSIQPAF